MPALDERTPAVKRAGRGSSRLAVADQLPEQVKAVIPVVTESPLTLGFLREDTYELETPFSWGTVAGQERRAALLRQALGARRAERALFTRPCSQAGRLDLGPGHAKHYIGDGGTLYGTGSSACFDPLLGCAPRTAPAGHLSWSGTLFLRLEESRLLRRVRHQKILGLLVVHGLIRAGGEAKLVRSWSGSWWRGPRWASTLGVSLGYHMAPHRQVRLSFLG